MTFLSKIENAKKLIKEYLDKYQDKAIAGISFGKDSMVLFHLIDSVKKNVQCFSIMTPFKPKETLAYKEEMMKKYEMKINTWCKGERADKPEWWKTDPDACCDYYKVEPTKEALGEYNVWFAGLRRDEGRTRTNYDYVEEKDGLIKVNPILDFTEKDIWKYMAIHGIPANPLYKEGYRSLGCAPCTHKEQDENETERAGRWLGTSKCGGECGIHSKSLR